MSASCGSATGSPGGGGAGGAAAGGDTSRVHHARSFKLRFAAQREPGRSYVSPVKPRGLPATVTGKFYARSATCGVDAAEEEETWSRALRTINDMFERGPRERYPAPLTAAHEYGWWWDATARAEDEARADRRRAHHLRDSPWLKARLLVLAADARLARR